MKMVGSVEVPPEAFLSILRSEDDEWQTKRNNGRNCYVS
jgi:hypothetical protein